jgi:hypothetical protein
MKVRTPDLSVVLLVLAIMVILATLSFELWIPHPFSNH